ncbi:MAG: TerB N-terminal domain-containing protein, partial [Oligoflexia bacterium]|nr:TerB N-terminal domain-containing protein [Oligoflexia bacterium]
KENYDYLGYWPSYSELNPGQRSMFLKWLSEGKNNTAIDIGYVFIYFYGLEYRVLQENKDLKLVAYEIIKLRKYYASNRSFQGYSERLLAYIISKLNDQNTIKEIFKTVEPSLDKYSIIYQSGIHLKIRDSNFLNTNDIISLIPSFENIDRSSIPKKVGEYFNQYFKIIAEEEIKETVSQVKPVEYREQYYSASNFLHREYYYKGLRIIVNRNMQNKLAIKWKKAIADFRPYSRKLNKSKPTEIFNLLPDKLRQIIDHPLKKQLKKVEEKLVGRAVSISEIVNHLRIEVSEKLKNKECEMIVNTLLHEDIIIEPNAVYFKKNYNKNDIVFLSKIENASMLKSSNYKLAALMVDLGVDLAYADNDYSTTEAQQIYLAVSSTFLDTDLEFEHLRLRVALYKDQRPNISGILKKISESLETRSLEILSSYLVGIALSDGIFTQEEDKKVRQLLSKLGVKSSYIKDIYRKFGVNKIFGNTELRASKNNHKKGSLIPKAKEIVLDQKKLNQIELDTEKVKLVLSKVITEDEENDYISTRCENNQVDTELDKKYASFLNFIIQKNKWDKKTLRDKAKEHKFMVSSGISKINEWAEEKHGDYLVFENDDNFEVNTLILEDIKNDKNKAS